MKPFLKNFADSFLIFAALQQFRLFATIKYYSFVLLLLASGFSFSQKSSGQDSTLIRKFFDDALVRGKSYEDLRSLCKGIGTRLSGSAQAQNSFSFC